MARIFESFRAFAYQSGVDSIHAAFQSSIATMQEAERKAGEDHWRYVDSGEDDDEYDEDGYLIHSTRHNLANAEVQVSYAAREVRRAFITSAFHYWERSARNLTKLVEIKHKFADLKDQSAKLHAISPDLDMLNHLNNVLKHDSIKGAEALIKIRSDHFQRAPYRKTPDGPLQWTLCITNAHVEEAIEIVRASGPQIGVYGVESDGRV
jgi:hypothetical protein